MSFSNTLNRLREAAKGQRGRNGDVLVSAYDLRDLLNDYDRIDAKHRAQNGNTAPNKLNTNAVAEVRQEPFKWALDHFALGIGTTLFDSEKEAIEFSRHLAGSSKAIPLYCDPVPAQAPAIPTGWQLMPTDPTEEMLDKAAESLYGHPRSKAIEWAKEEKFDSYVDDAVGAYYAFIDASPKPNEE